MRADQLRWALVPAVVVLYLFVALTLALKLNIWLAEPYTLHTTGSGPGYALEQSIHFEIQPPFYFLVLSLWRSIDGSIFFVTLFSALCSAAPQR